MLSSPYATDPSYGGSKDPCWVDVDSSPAAPRVKPEADEIYQKSQGSIGRLLQVQGEPVYRPPSRQSEWRDKGNLCYSPRTMRLWITIEMEHTGSWAQLSTVQTLYVSCGRLVDVLTIIAIDLHLIEINNQYFYIVTCQYSKKAEQRRVKKKMKKKEKFLKWISHTLFLN